MDIEFDQTKDETNREKHGISLARASEMELLSFIDDARKPYGEIRYRAWGSIGASPSHIATVASGRAASGEPIRRRSSAMPARKTERDNPVWTASDFNRAKTASELPADILKVFPRTRGAQKAPTKVPVSIRLSLEVVEHFKSGGRGWQARIDETLTQVVRDAHSDRRSASKASGRTRRAG